MGAAERTAEEGAMTRAELSTCGFSVTGFQTVDKLTLRSVPQSDFWTVDFRTVIEYKIHPLINKK